MGLQAQALADDEAGGFAAQREGFFTCDFIWAPNELPGDEPYLVFGDAQSDPFFPGLINACRGSSGFKGLTTDIEAVRAFDGIVFIEGPVWRRNFEALGAARPNGRGLKVVLYFERDPSGFWDFAKACGADLAAIAKAGGLSPSHTPAVADFIETWAGQRVAAGRILPMAKYYTGDYRQTLERNGAKITRVMAALADDQSRSHYARILFGTNEQVFSAFAGSVFGPQQYMDIVRVKPGDVVVNCGVGNGWELPYFLSRLQGEGRIFNFDPNMCYEGTVYGAYIALFRDMIVDNKIVLGDHDGTIKLPSSHANMLRSDGAVRAAGDGEGFESYTCRTLDSVMREGLSPRLDYVKMDVEGGEIYILKGAINAIRQYRPKLAIAIYHEPEHFWDYPLYLMDALQDYRFYVRQYGYSRFETLLYCVPKEDDESGSAAERLMGDASAGAREEPAKDQLALYFRDRRGAERKIYSGPQRVLTRLFGVRWETAEFRPAPQIEADEVVGVYEQHGDGLILTKHVYAPGSVQLTIGEVRNNVDVAWTSAVGVSPEAVGAVIASTDGVARFVAYEPAHRAARLYRYAKGAIQSEFDFELTATPIAGSYKDGVLTLDLFMDEGRAISEQTFTRKGRRAEGVAVQVGSVPIVGAALIKGFGVDGARYERAYLAPSQDGQTLSVYRRDGDAIVLDRTIGWDPRLDVVSVVL